MNMKRKVFIRMLLGFIFSICAIFITQVEAEELIYNRTAAKDYAARWCNDVNKDKFKEFPRVDCANFVSQSVMTGFGAFDTDGNIVGNPFGCVKGAPIISTAGTTKGIPLARELGSALTNSFCFKEVSLADAKDGDVITFQNNSKKNKDNPTGTVHSGILNKDGNVAAHSNPHSFSEGRKPSYFGMDSYKIYQFQDGDKCKKCERNEKTCKAELKEKCTGCLYCEESTGECKDPCVDKGVFRCASRWKCIEMTDKSGPLCYKMGPSGDCPDDTLTIGSSTPISSEITHSSGTSSVGILKAGYSYDILKVLSTFGQQARIISPNDFDPSLVSEMPLFIIPTGGLVLTTRS